ncbi:MAG: radical SAM family heme chaperone HemW [Bacteroidota bacterium]
MGGIYLHIPFCRKACTYCDFHFSTNLSKQKELVVALQEEIRLRKAEIQSLGNLRTLYFGGGTPSILNKEEISSLIQEIRNLLPFSEDIEITLEANPDDLKEAYLHELREIGVNRLSIGTQSFSDEVLKWMNRSHDAAQSIDAIKAARLAGFDNFSCDLIFGNPFTDEKIWEADVQHLLALKPPHISAYSLTVEEKTLLFHQLNKEQIDLPTEEVYQKQYLKAHDLFTQAGYEHYELSNYALPGYRSKHNSAYWDGLAYVGIGPSAHSYDGNRRSWNVANNSKYLKLLAGGKPATEEEEILTEKDRYHEYLMTQLRKEDGIDIRYIQKHWINNWKNRFRPQIQEMQEADWIEIKHDRLAIRPQSWLLSNQIIREFFL